MDRKIHFNKITKELEDGDFDDDFSICPFPPADIFGLHTEKTYCAEVCLHRYTEGRAKNILPYIQQHMQTTEELEIWHVWLDDAETPEIKTKEISLSELSTLMLKEINEVHPTFKPLVHYCYKISK